MIGQQCLGLCLEVPFWCSFRDPATSNFHKTFMVPPPTTLYGLIAAAMGLNQDDFSLRNKIRFAIAIKKKGDVIEVLSKWMKISRSDSSNPVDKFSSFSSTLVMRQKIINPVYVIGIFGEKDLLDKIKNAIINPACMLYLGESDDFVDISVLGYDEIKVCSHNKASGVVSGVNMGGVISNLPHYFSSVKRNSYELKNWLVTIPNNTNIEVIDNSNLVEAFGYVWEFEPEIKE